MKIRLHSETRAKRGFRIRIIDILREIQLNYLKTLLRQSIIRLSYLRAERKFGFPSSSSDNSKLPNVASLSALSFRDIIYFHFHDSRFYMKQTRQFYSSLERHLKKNVSPEISIFPNLDSGLSLSSNESFGFTCTTNYPLSTQE